ncbi:hypothetical protein F4778DRAFT_553710 [Xylariomycetidae sp. FL2044]|nr:hypothetical protein F4778DRAFT_553710 [Xylariomycetidae sp. FL2044]
MSLCTPGLVVPPPLFLSVLIIVFFYNLPSPMMLSRDWMVETKPSDCFLIYLYRHFYPLTYFLCLFSVILISCHSSHNRDKEMMTSERAHGYSQFPPFRVHIEIENPR